MLRVNQLTGFSVRRAPPRNILITVPAGFNFDFNLYDALVTAGERPDLPITPGSTIEVRMLGGIGSTFGDPAYRTRTTGQTYGAGWSLADNQITVPLSVGAAGILGKGGDGALGAGYFIGAPYYLYVDDAGNGGGGAGLDVGLGAVGLNSAPGGDGSLFAGGAGGAANDTGFPIAIPGGAGGNGGVAIEASAGGPNITLRPAAGATLNVWGGGGGGGGGGQTGSTSQAGGNGGGPGLNGAAGGGSSAAGAGGTRGLGVSTPGSATVTNVGPGTVDIRGV